MYPLFHISFTQRKTSIHTLDKSWIQVYTYYRQFCYPGISSANNSIGPMVESLDIGILVKQIYTTVFALAIGRWMNSNICLTQATVNILDISRLEKLINISSCHGYTSIDTSADMNCGYTRTIEGIYICHWTNVIVLGYRYSHGELI